MAGRISRLTAGDVDQKSIVALSQTCTEELEAKTREKTALTKLLNELKKKKQQYDGRIAKKKREVDAATVQTMEIRKKMSIVENGNRMMMAELNGLRKENERLEIDVQTLRRDLQAAIQTYDKECMEVEKVKKMINTYQREMNAEGKHRETVQQDLRASKTAQSLMMDRLDDMEKRNRALRTCVTDTVNS